MGKVDLLFSTHGPMDAQQWGSFEEQQEGQMVGMQGRFDKKYPLPGCEIQGDKYPFKGFVGKESSLLELEYLLGPGCVRGGCILVTGCRGAGKTTLVNRAIYEAGLLGRYHITVQGEEGPFEALHRQLENKAELREKKKKGKKGQFKKEEEPALIIEVRVNQSSPISADDLIRRLVRSFYWALVGSGIAGLVPDLVASARMAYIRTVGTVDHAFEEWLKEINQQTTGLKVTAKDGLEVQVGAAAQVELQIARKMAIHLGISQKEELEEELLRLFDGLQGSHLGVKQPLWKRIARVASWANDVWEAIGESILGGQGLRVSLVVVFDELDKLDGENESRPDNLQDQSNQEDESNGTDTNTNGEAADGDKHEPPTNMIELGPRTVTLLKEFRTDMLRAGDGSIRTSTKIAEALKPILSSGRATFIFVGGTSLARSWRESRGKRDALLPSVFTDHIHVGLLGEDDVHGLLKSYFDGWDKMVKPESTDPTERAKCTNRYYCMVFGLLARSICILKEFLLELRSLASKNEHARGKLNEAVITKLVNDDEFCLHAKKARVIEYALHDYEHEGAKALAKRPVFARNPSLLDDVKITYYGWLREMPEGDTYGAVLTRLFPELAKERALLADLANVIEAFPERPKLEDLDIIYDEMLGPLKQQWPSILQDEGGSLG